jgi:NADH:ubiquinone oxidoreductase subunit F (NADH-binding)
MLRATTSGFLLGDQPVATGRPTVPWAAARDWRSPDPWPPEEVTAEIGASGLRCRRGAGFPTGTTWASVQGGGGRHHYAVCNGAEGLIGDVPVFLVNGPEEYLFGEEKALLEVIEGNDPFPRWPPPYVHAPAAERGRGRGGP